MSSGRGQSLFPVVDVDAHPQLGYEQMGSKDKFWVEYRDWHWLFKYPLRFDGERWSEMVAYHVGEMMELPMAEIALGRHVREDGEVKLGTLSKSVVDKESRGEQLVHGNEAIQEMALDSYVLDGEDQPGLDAVLDYFDEYGVAGPDGEPTPDASFYFAGFLVLDALVGNVDRHHENWGVATRPGGRPRLVASFDHGACLGRELSETKRGNYLDNKQVRFYVDGGKAKISPPSKPERVPPYELLDSLAELDLEDARDHWIERALEVDDDQIEAVFRRFPDGWVSPLAPEFALEYMRVARRHLEEMISR